MQKEAGLFDFIMIGSSYEVFGKHVVKVMYLLRNKENIYGSRHVGKVYLSYLHVLFGRQAINYQL